MEPKGVTVPCKLHSGMLSAYILSIKKVVLDLAAINICGHLFCSTDTNYEYEKKR
jgi:hypothetical protein